MRLSLYAISDPRKISEIREAFDAFVIKNSVNPFMLSVFIEKKMESSLRKGATPIVLVFMTEGNIVSVEPLLITKRFGIGFASLLFDPWFSPDFIVEKQYGEVCLQNSLNFVFDHLQCQFETLDLPTDSLNLPMLIRICETKSISYSTNDDAWLDHCVILVDRTWDEFQKSKNRNFRRRFKRIEQQLDSSGQWQILQFENENDEQGVFQRIMEIEDASWKQNWREQRSTLVDDELLNVWEASTFAAKTCPEFSRNVWFLELNGQAIAYTMVLQYKGTAYTCKTSYKKQYRKLSTGIYLKNAVIRDLFNSGRVRMIDFMTNLPFQERWTSTHLSRVEFSLSKGIFPNLFEFTFQQPITKKVLRRLLPKAITNVLSYKN
jgi:Acetyltransferase (GNAT) domain